MMETSTHAYLEFDIALLEGKIQAAEFDGWAVRQIIPIQQGRMVQYLVVYERPARQRQEFATFGDPQ